MMQSTQPRKRFGQHFLCDKNIIERIVKALQPNKSDQLVEIGPGQGALTVPVLRHKVSLDVIEIDRDLILELKDRTYHFSDFLRIHSEDVLKFDFAKLCKPKSQLRIFGNLPYNISTPLLFHLIEYAPMIKDMLFMLQKEVAERMSAKPDTSEYGRLSVMVQYHCTVDLLFDVPREAFFPPPKVRSSIVRLIPHRQYPHQAKNYKIFADLVRHAFNQRRKTLRNSLKEMVSDEVWAQLTIPKTARAEDLSVGDFVTIANFISKG